MPIKTKDSLLDEDDILGYIASKSAYAELRYRILVYFEKIFQEKYNHRLKLKNQLFLEISINVIITIQMITFAWYPNMNMSGWDSYSQFWNLIGYISPDSLFADLGIYEVSFYTVVSAIGYCLLCLLLIAVLGCLNQKIPWILIVIPRKILMILNTVMFIPSVSILSIIFKYSAFDYTDCIEYSSISDPSKLNFGPVGALIALIFLIFLLFIILFSEIFTSDIRHSSYQKNIRARSNSKIDIHIILFCYIECILYVFFGGDHIKYFETILMIFSTAILWETLHFLPYFNLAGNSIQACKMFIISCTLLFFLIGETMDNGSLIVLFELFVLPPLTILIIKKVKNNFLALSQHDKMPNDQYKFEQIVRHLLVNKQLEDKISVIKLFTNCYKKSFERDKMLIIWETNYCLHILKDERLARIKLAKAADAKSSFEGDIHAMRLSNRILESNSSSLSEVHYLSYLQDLSKVKHMDEEACILLIDLWTEINMRIPSTQKLVKLVYRIHDLITNIKTLYSMLSSKHKQTEVYDLYSSFLENILRDVEQSEMINRKKTAFRNSLDLLVEENKKLNMFGERNGIILISANSESFGTIAYMNQNAGDILKIPFEAGIGVPLSYFIPKPFDHNHDQFMKEFYNSCTTTEVTTHFNLFLQSQQGFLVECKFMIRLTAVENRAYILASFRRRNSKREIALISDKGVIYNHSERFPFYIGQNNYFLRNKHLSDIIPNFDISTMDVCSPLIVSSEDIQILLVHLVRKFRSTEIHILAVIYDEKEISLWKEGHETEQIEFFRNAYFKEMKAEESKTYEGDVSVSELMHSKDRVKFISLNSSAINLGDETSHTQIIYETTMEESKAVTNSKSQSTLNYNGNTTSNNNSKRFAYNILSNSEKKLKIFTWILFLSIAAVIGINIGIVICMYNNIAQTTTANSFNDLGTLLCSLGSLVNKAIELNIDLAKNSESFESDLSSFNSTINVLIGVENSILNDIDNLHYCSSSEIILDPKIPIWDINDEDLITYQNLYDAIQRYINNCINFLESLKKSEIEMDSLSFILFNGLGYLYDYIKISTESWVQCESDRIESIVTNITVLLNAAIVILVVFQGFLISYIAYINKGMNSYWNFIKLSSQASYLELKRALLERLSTVHGLDYEKDHSSTKKADSKSEILPHVYWRYTRKLLVFFIISTSYYFLIEFHLYKDCSNYAKNRPKLLHNFIIRESSILRINIASYSELESLMLHYFHNINIKNQSRLMEDEIKMYKESLNDLRNDKYLDLISDQLKERLFEKIDTDVDLLKYGLSSSSFTTSYQSLYFFNSSEVSIIKQNIWEIENELIYEFNLADEDSKSIINYQLNIIIYVTEGYSSLLIILYLFYYVPFLYKEKKLLKKLKILPMIIPSSKINSKEETEF
ncbi:unnamed protein product [Blepharisma stoltei]|uniref:TmcB/TmcC TPR repeats domain-containing protein n=1 Tax=Blepharisma stoltei TaxID=1481888 RepID=A0AAU9KCC4_9CILI|nr:unnamed protein product [Blepharisma stoltei]